MLKILLLIIFLLLVELLLSNTLLSVRFLTIKNENIPSSFNGYKIVQLSDLHSRSYGKNNACLLRKVKEQQPDIIVLTGDMVSSTHTSFDTFYSLARSLVKICPVYYVIGNHEQMLLASLQDELLNTIQSIGIIVLDNEKISLKKEEESIDLYGLWFNLRYYRNLRNLREIYSFEPENMYQLLGSKSNAFTILLTHNPLYFKTYAEWGANLTLSGHMHGGLIRIPFIGGLLSPEVKFFPSYDAGLYTINNHMLYVNCGLASGLFGIRFFNHPEISVFMLSNKL